MKVFCNRHNGPSVARASARLGHDQYPFPLSVSGEWPYVVATPTRTRMGLSEYQTSGSKVRTEKKDIGRGLIPDGRCGGSVANKGVYRRVPIAPSIGTVFIPVPVGRTRKQNGPDCSEPICCFEGAPVEVGSTYAAAFHVPVIQASTSAIR